MMDSNPSSQKSRGLFIQMSGAPGSGKSTLARLLRQSIGGVVIDHDVFRSTLLEYDDMAFDQVAKRAYSLQWAFAEDVLKQGLNVVIDSPCNYQEGLDQGSALAEKYEYAYWYVECKVEDLDLLDQRLRLRVPMRSQRTAIDSPPAGASSARIGEPSRGLFEKWVKNPCRPDRNTIVVDSTNNAEANRDQILEHLSLGSNDR